MLDSISGPKEAIALVIIVITTIQNKWTPWYIFNSSSQPLHTFLFIKHLIGKIPRMRYAQHIFENTLAITWDNKRVSCDMNINSWCKKLTKKSLYFLWDHKMRKHVCMCMCSCIYLSIHPCVIGVLNMYMTQSGLLFWTKQSTLTKIHISSLYSSSCSVCFSIWKKVKKKKNFEFSHAFLKHFVLIKLQI